jgi:hypothetical protein
LLKIPLLTGTDFYVILMPKDEWNDKARIFKADMYEKNTFSIPVSWSYLILYEPTWYESGYF